MTARGYLRGHPLVFVKGQWVYEDDGTAIPVTGQETRPCIKCGVLSEDGVDPCLGVLAGVDNACCGHGIPSEAYVMFAK